MCPDGLCRAIKAGRRVRAWSLILTLIVIPAVYTLVKGIGLERAKELAPVAAE
jgi:hypothetical protein